VDVKERFTGSLSIQEAGEQLARHLGSQKLKDGYFCAQGPSCFAITDQRTDERGERIGAKGGGVAAIKDDERMMLRACPRTAESTSLGFYLMKFDRQVR